MYVFRPARESDLAALFSLAGAVSGGLTSLPKDEGFLRDRIDESLRAFDPKIRKPGNEKYLFVLENLEGGEVVGTAGIAARVGGFDPFYSYEIRRQKFEHKPMKIEKSLAVLHLKKTHSGPTEIGSLFLRADSRRAGLGRLLSLARFLFIAAFPSRFDTNVIAEIRGYIDQQGKSPFWESVGRHFFDHDFYTADFLSGLGNKAFIADLMPDLPIYVKLLPESVQAAIGRVHHDSEPALALLLAEGFERTSEVDIFDAGPLVRADCGRLRTIAQSRRDVISEIVPIEPEGVGRLLARPRLDFRVVLSPITETSDGIKLGRDAADALSVKPGEVLLHSPVK